MHSAEEFTGQSSGRTRVLPTYRRLRARPGRIRYAHDEAVPPLCTLPAGASGHYGGTGYWAGREDLGTAWSARFPVAEPRHDLWVLVCGGIATAAAFAAAFIASGGVASHAATSVNTVPIAVTRACPTPAP
jgi:hypothetical protein